MNGPGKVRFQDGTLHEGEYKNGVLNGEGKYQNIDGSTY